MKEGFSPEKGGDMSGKRSFCGLAMESGEGARMQFLSSSLKKKQFGCKAYTRLITNASVIQDA